jgi:phosphoenolpyruvate carboxykinase (ATP)
MAARSQSPTSFEYAPHQVRKHRRTPSEGTDRFHRTLETNLSVSDAVRWCCLNVPPPKLTILSQEDSKLSLGAGVDNEGDVDKSLAFAGIQSKQVFRNAPAAILYEQALRREKGTRVSDTGALVALSGTKTGRSPADKRIVEEDSSMDRVWWGPVNVKMTDNAFRVNRERAIDYLNTRDELYVFDGYAGWDPKYRVNIRVIATRAYHALFMSNMLIRPTKEELRTFEPDFVIYNAGAFPCNRFTEGMTSSTSVSLHLGRMEMVILGTEYAGEMKKGVLTLMMYLMPEQGQLCLHSSANEDEATGSVSLFFGLSGTGKTTLSADPARNLIGDDEHVWTEQGVFNIEGGCYAKCIGLKEENEPEIYRAIRFGSVVENVVMDDRSRSIDFEDVSITQNTRCAYPLEFIPNCKIPAVCSHPTNVFLLTCDAFGVLPPVSKLTNEQVMYHFISGYTSKVAGTEVGITRPTPEFSACYGQPFLVRHPMVYAQQLKEQMEKFACNAWLINTGWVGGVYGVGHRMSIKNTRAIIDAIHSGELAETDTLQMDIFGLRVPVECSGVPSDVLKPWLSWSSEDAYWEEAKMLGSKFVQNFEKYAQDVTAEVLAAGPQL